MKETPLEIVKRIPSPDESPEKVHEDEIIFEEHLVYEQEHQKSNRKLILGIFGVAVTGIIGFYGSKLLSKNDNDIVNLSSTPLNTPIANEKSEPIETKLAEKHRSHSEISQTEDSQEKIAISNTPHYTEALALPTQKQNEPTTPTESNKNIPKINMVEKRDIQEVASIKKTEPILVSKTPLNIIEIVHERPMTLEEFNAKESATKAKELPIAEPVIVEDIPTVFYEKIKPRHYTVRKHDSLATIAKRFYGDPFDYKRIVRANRRIRSSKTALHLGEKLLIPRKDGKQSRRYIIVEHGDTLARLAKRFYGDSNKINKIIHANYKIKNSHSMLHIGQKVYLPN